MWTHCPGWPRDPLPCQLQHQISKIPDTSFPAYGSLPRWFSPKIHINWSNFWLGLFVAVQEVATLSKFMSRTVTESRTINKRKFCKCLSFGCVSLAVISHCSLKGPPSKVRFIVKKKWNLLLTTNSESREGSFHTFKQKTYLWRSGLGHSSS